MSLSELVEVAALFGAVWRSLPPQSWELLPPSSAANPQT